MRLRERIICWIFGGGGDGSVYKGKFLWSFGDLSLNLPSPSPKDNYSITQVFFSLTKKSFSLRKVLNMITVSSVRRLLWKPVLYPAVSILEIFVLQLYHIRQGYQSHGLLGQNQPTEHFNPALFFPPSTPACSHPSKFKLKILLSAGSRGHTCWTSPLVFVNFFNSWKFWWATLK